MDSIKKSAIDGPIIRQNEFNAIRTTGIQNAESSVLSECTIDKYLGSHNHSLSQHVSQNNIHNSGHVKFDDNQSPLPAIGETGNRKQTLDYQKANRFKENIQTAGTLTSYNSNPDFALSDARMNSFRDKTPIPEKNKVPAIKPKKQIKYENNLKNAHQTKNLKYQKFLRKQQNVFGYRAVNRIKQVNEKGEDDPLQKEQQEDDFTMLEASQMTFDEHDNDMISPDGQLRRRTTNHNKSIEIRKFKDSHLNDFERQQTWCFCIPSIFRRNNSYSTKKKKWRNYEEDYANDPGISMEHHMEKNLNELGQSGTNVSSRPSMISLDHTRRINKRPQTQNSFDKRTTKHKSSRFKSRFKFKNVALSNKDNWLAYLQSNLKNIDQLVGGSEWSQTLQKYIKDEKQNFNQTKYKGDLFFFKYTLDQKSNNQRQRFLSELEQVNMQGSEEKKQNVSKYSSMDNEPHIYGFDNQDETALNHLKLLKIAQEKGKRESKLGEIPNQAALLRLKTAKYTTNLEEISEGEELSPELKLGDMKNKFQSEVPFQTKNSLRHQTTNKGAKEDSFVEVIEEVDEEQENNEESEITMLVKQQEDETIDNMKPRIKKLFNLIKTQLSQPDHPLNLLAQKFVESYVNYYDQQIKQDMKQFEEKKLQEFQIQQMQDNTKSYIGSGVKDRKLSESQTSRLPSLAQYPPTAFDQRKGSTATNHQITSVGKGIEVKSLEMGNSVDYLKTEGAGYLNQLDEQFNSYKRPPDYIEIDEEIVSQDKSYKTKNNNSTIANRPSIEDNSGGRNGSFNHTIQQKEKRSIGQNQETECGEDQPAVSYTVIERALNEIKEFITILFGSAIRFYNTLLLHQELELMKEDLIERITTMLFHNKQLTQLVLQLCKIATAEESKKFKTRLQEAIDLDLAPWDLSVDKYFSLDKNSGILDIFKRQYQNQSDKQKQEIDGKHLPSNSDQSMELTSTPITNTQGNVRSTEVDRIQEEDIIESGDVGGSGSGDKSYVENENETRTANSQREQLNVNNQKGSKESVENTSSMSINRSNERDKEEEKEEEFQNAEKMSSMKQLTDKKSIEPSINFSQYHTAHRFPLTNSQLADSEHVELDKQENMQESQMMNPRQIQSMINQEARGNTMKQFEDKDKQEEYKSLQKSIDSCLQDADTQFYNELKARCKRLPYEKAIMNLNEIYDVQKYRSPFEMIKCIANTSVYIEKEIDEFWNGVPVNRDKLMIDGENNMILYFYIVLRARIPFIFAYMKLIQEFSTTYVRSISKYGHCMCTLEISLERILQSSIAETLQIQNHSSVVERKMSFADGVRKSIKKSAVRAESFSFDDLIPDKQRASSKTVSYIGRVAESIQGSKHGRRSLHGSVASFEDAEKNSQPKSNKPKRGNDFMLNERLAAEGLAEGIFENHNFKERYASFATHHNHNSNTNPLGQIAGVLQQMTKQMNSTLIQPIVHKVQSIATTTPAQGQGEDSEIIRDADQSVNTSLNNSQIEARADDTLETDHQNDLENIVDYEDGANPQRLSTDTHALSKRHSSTKRDFQKAQTDSDLFMNPTHNSVKRHESVEETKKM